MRVLAIAMLAVSAFALAGCGGKVGGGKYLSKLGWGKDRGEYVVLINTFTVPAGKTDEAVAMWEKARDFMREQDGYISTRLHISLDEGARYRLINIARWRSAEHFRAAANALRQSGVIRPVPGVRGSPHLYKAIGKGRK